VTEYNYHTPEQIAKKYKRNPEYIRQLCRNEWKAQGRPKVVHLPTHIFTKDWIATKAGASWQIGVPKPQSQQLPQHEEQARLMRMLTAILAIEPNGLEEALVNRIATIAKDLETHSLMDIVIERFQQHLSTFPQMADQAEIPLIDGRVFSRVLFSYMLAVMSDEDVVVHFTFKPNGDVDSIGEVKTMTDLMRNVSELLSTNEDDTEYNVLVAFIEAWWTQSRTGRKQASDILVNFCLHCGGPKKGSPLTSGKYFCGQQCRTNHGKWIKRLSRMPESEAAASIENRLKRLKLGYAYCN
jgi:hypothetical protein